MTNYTDYADIAEYIVSYEDHVESSLSLKTLKNSFITDCADYDDIQGLVKNSSIIDYDHDTNFWIMSKLIPLLTPLIFSSLTTLPALFFRTMLKIISSLTTLTMLIFT